MATIVVLLMIWAIVIALIVNDDDAWELVLMFAAFIVMLVAVFIFSLQ